MAQFFQNRPSFEEILGKSLGGGLGNALEDLAQLKLQQLKEQQALQQNMPTEGNAPFASGPTRVKAASRSKKGLRTKMAKGYQFNTPKEEGNELQLPKKENDISEKLKNLAIQKEVPSQELEEPEMVTKKKPISSIGKIGKDHKKEIEPTIKVSKAEQTKIDKETLPAFRQITDGYKASKSANIRLDKMEHLINNGSLPISTFHNLFKSLSEGEFLKEVPVLGGAFGAVGKLIGGLGSAIQRNITSRDTEQFEKLSNDFIKDAKQIFGSRITDADLRAFMKTVPTLEQTDQGKLKIINNMRAMNKVAELRYNAMKEIIKENGGKRPENLEFEIEDRIGPEMDEVASEFTAGLPVRKKVTA